VDKFDGKTDISINQAACHLKVGWHVVKKWLDYLGIKRKVRKKIPMSSEKQKKRQKIILNKISKQEFKATNDIDIMMDDETYIDFNGFNFAGNTMILAILMSKTKSNIKRKQSSHRNYWSGLPSVKKEDVLFTSGLKRKVQLMVTFTVKNV